jgi:hypothetical protein
MLKKRSYDILFLIGIIALGIKLYSLINAILTFKPTIELSWILDIFNSSSLALTGQTYNILTYLALFIVWIFLLCLSIELYKKEKIKILIPILIAIFLPLAPVFYLTNLRKPLKDYSEKNTHKIKSLGNVPGTP